MYKPQTTYHIVRICQRTLKPLSRKKVIKHFLFSPPKNAADTCESTRWYTTLAQVCMNRKKKTIFVFFFSSHNINKKNFIPLLCCKISAYVKSITFHWQNRYRGIADYLKKPYKRETAPHKTVFDNSKKCDKKKFLFCGSKSDKIK